MHPNIKPTAKQHLAWQKLQDKNTKVVVYGGAAGGGKSWLGCEWLLVQSYFFPGTRWFIGREELKRLRSTTMLTFYKVLKHHNIPVTDWTYNGQDHYLQCTNGGRIDLLDLKYLPSDPLYERYGSEEFTGGWIEEGGEVDFGAYDTLKSRVGRAMNQEYNLLGKILITCNPKKNWLYTEFYKPFRAGQLNSDVSFIQAYVTDNKYLDDNYINSLKSITDKSKKERLLNGNWEYDDDPSTLCEYDAIVSIFENDHVSGGVKYITADIARMGSDKALIGVWSGWRLIERVSYDVSKTTEIQTTINTLRQKHAIPKRNCIADEDGVGGGVVDNTGILGFVNNAKALNDENYYNLQSQCCYKLAEHINESSIYIECELSTQEREDIKEEMEQLKSYQSDKDGKMRILPKEQIKENIGRSPDWRDLLMMRVYFDLLPPAPRPVKIRF